MSVSLKSMLHDTALPPPRERCVLRIAIVQGQRDAQVIALGVEIGKVCERIGLESETIVLGFKYCDSVVKQITLNFDDEASATAFRTATRLKFEL